MSESDEEKTEDPTHKRLEDARKKGQVSSSKEVSNFFMIFTLSLIIMMIAPWTMKNTTLNLTEYLSKSWEFNATPDGFTEVGKSVVIDSLSALALPFILLVVAAIAGSFIQFGFLLSAQPIIPKLEKISLRKGFGRIFSRRSFMEFVKGIIKIIIIGLVAYYAVTDQLTILEQTPMLDPHDIMHLIKSLCADVLISVTIAIFLIAIIDFIYQKAEFIKQMRMSKHEVKEEYKQAEGDPKIKGKLKQMRMERARKRMMSAVPTADVIITNPTHYAVALKYEQDKAAAPIVVAMGVDKVAERIKQLAEENKVPIVRNAPLARALYDEGDLDEEIPFTHYQAVAEVISYVFKLRDKK